MSKIAENLAQINYNIEAAAKKAGRSPGDVKLLAVSKSVGVPEAAEAYGLGLRDFAENRVQKLLEKQDGLKDKADINWHLIGQLQTNKIKYIAGKVTLVHSVDRYNLAAELSRYAAAHDLVIDALLELNISGEESKTGMPVRELSEFLEKFGQLPNIRLCGLMTMAPLAASEPTLRRIFSAARELEAELRSRRVPNMPMGQLSMGMSGDYQIAIEEGATIVRIGTALFAE